MSYRAVVLAPLTVVIAIAFCAFSQQRLDAEAKIFEQEEMLYLPNKMLLKHFTAGLNGVLADILWIQTVAYVVEEFFNPENRFTWLNHLCNTATDLDPYFEGVYVSGGMFMAATRADDGAVQLFKKGMHKIPDSWRIPLELVKVHVLNRRSRPESPELVKHYLRMAADRSEKPERFLYWIDSLGTKKDMKDQARAIWTERLNASASDVMAKLAREKLIELDILDNIERILAAISVYETQTGTRPHELQDVIRIGILRLPGQAKLEEQGTYYLDAKGTPKNTVLLAQTTKDALRKLNGEIEQFHQRFERYPATLQEWSELTGHKIPAHPYDGEEWDYDPRTGMVER